MPLPVSHKYWIISKKCLINGHHCPIFGQYIIPLKTQTPHNVAVVSLARYLYII